MTEASSPDVPIYFEKNFDKIKQILNDIAGFINPTESIWADGPLFESIDFNKIFSKKESGFQALHMDFAGSDDVWEQYYANSKKHGLTPLSCKHFPEGKQIGSFNFINFSHILFYFPKGGRLILLQCDPSVTANIMNSDASVNRAARRAKVFSHTYINKVKITTQTKAVEYKVLKLKPNSTVLFR